MIRIGIVGVGFMGMIHFLAAKKLKDAVVTALCSRDPKKRAGDWRGIRGNFGPPGTMMDLAGIKTYADVGELLADPMIDLVDVCLPTDLHRPVAEQALAAGKHVIVEKAIALTPQDADAMLAAARKANRLLMVAHVLPFFPEFAFAADFLGSGKGGKLLAAHFERIISKPDWSADIADAAKTGGPAIDLHIHDTHFIGLTCGVPHEVFSRGVVEKGSVTHVMTQYLYGPGGPPCVTCASGALCQSARPFMHGYTIYMEKATLLYQSGAQPLVVLSADGKSEQPKLAGGDDATTAFTLELQAAVDGVKAGAVPDLLSAKLARDALVMCHKEVESVKSGRAVALGGQPAT
jgi:predicted dehydrogenase